MLHHPWSGDKTKRRAGQVEVDMDENPLESMTMHSSLMHPNAQRALHAWEYEVKHPAPGDRMADPPSPEERARLMTAQETLDCIMEEALYHTPSWWPGI